VVTGAVAVDEEEHVPATGFVEGGLGVSAGQQVGPVSAAGGDGAQVAAEEGGGQAGLSAGGDGRWGAVGFAGDGDSR
jgi:hypothetical protein